MKQFVKLLVITLMLYSCGSSDAIFELTPQQSMSIVGKGPGQDAAINPFGKEKSIAKVKNLGKTSFSVRIQKQGKIITETPVPVKEKKEFVLEKGYELYFDSEAYGKAKITFKKFR